MRRRGPVQERVERLRELEREYRHQPQELRVKLLRLLAEEPGLRLVDVARVLGRHPATVERWWRRYREGGLAALLAIGQRRGRRPVRIGEAGLADLQARLAREGFADLRSVQAYLAAAYGERYTLSGVWYLVRVECKAKLKTGRPRAVQQNAQAVRDFPSRG